MLGRGVFYKPGHPGQRRSLLADRTLRIGTVSTATLAVFDAYIDGGPRDR
jgi:hypothetical protein